MNSKHCPYCNCNTKVIKFGVTSSKKQRYKCKKCGKSWTSKPHSQVISRVLWDKFVFSNMNVRELAREYGISRRQVHRLLHSYQPPCITPTKAIVIAIDVTYFGRSWGILTVLNAKNGKVLYCENQ